MADTGIASFDAQTRAFRVARNVLVVRYREHLPADALSDDLLATEVLPAVDRISRGLTLDVGASEMPADLAAALLERAGQHPGPTPNAERRAALAERCWEQLRDLYCPRLMDHAEGTMLAAAHHARIVFALIPKLPAERVSWPAPSLVAGYGDVLPPADLEDLIDRVDELATVLSRMAIGREIEPDGRFRRTYAFCETAAWLDPDPRANRSIAGPTA